MAAEHKKLRITDEKWADLQARARKADSRSLFDPETVKQRKASQEQARKSRWS